MLWGVLLLLGGSGCSRPEPLSITGPEVSQYVLQTIDGRGLPYQIDQSPDGTQTTVVNDMVLTLVSDGTWSTVGHETVTTNGTPTQLVVRGSGAYVTGETGTAFHAADGAVVWTGESLSPGYVLTDTQGRRYLFGR